MTPTPDSPDELAGTEQPSSSTSIELRDRLLRSIYGILAAIVGPRDLARREKRLIDWLARPIKKAHMPPTRS